MTLLLVINKKKKSYNYAFLKITLLLKINRQLLAIACFKVVHYLHSLYKLVQIIMISFFEFN